MRRPNAQERQRRKREMRRAEAPIEEKYHHDPREAARAIDGEAMKARGETPPWEEEASCEDVCTERCQGPCGWADA